MKDLCNHLSVEGNMMCCIPEADQSKENIYNQRRTYASVRVAVPINDGVRTNGHGIHVLSIGGDVKLPRAVQVGTINQVDLVCECLRVVVGNDQREKQQRGEGERARSRKLSAKPDGIP